MAKKKRSRGSLSGAAVKAKRAAPACKKQLSVCMTGKTANKRAKASKCMKQFNRCSR